MSYLDFDATWTSSTRLDFCLPERNEATIALSSDERKIYLYEDSTGSGDIYFSDFYAQKFNEIKILPFKGLNTKYWETHCMMTHDGSKFYFVSDRPGGYGGRDIYMMSKTNDSTWSNPINLGEKINSRFDEDAPFVSIDNKTLYYSSNGEKSIGGFDVLVSNMLADGSWSESKNVGYPFNSTNDDIYYTTTIDGLRGYMTSFRKDGFGEKDIYEIQNDFLGVKSLAVLNGLIRTRDNSPLPEDFVITMQLKCRNCEDAESVRILYPRLRDGVFITDLKPCKTYELSYINVADKTNMYTEEFSTACIEEYQKIDKELILDIENKTIIPAKKYILDGIVADRNTAEKLFDAKIEVFDASNTVIETAYSNDKGEFDLKFIQDSHYGDNIFVQLRISKDTYLTQSFDVSLTLGDEEKFHLSYLLEKSEVGIDIADVFDIKPIYFDFDKSTIRPDAKIELDKLVKIMNENPTLEIEYGSHTDCRGTKKYNLSLSNKRAKSSAAYIKARITKPQRIIGKGYGESELVNNCECEGKKKSNCLVEEHQANRRTEFIIVKK